MLSTNLHIFRTCAHYMASVQDPAGLTSSSAHLQQLAQAVSCPTNAQSDLVHDMCLLSVRCSCHQHKCRVCRNDDNCFCKVAWCIEIFQCTKAAILASYSKATMTTIWWQSNSYCQCHDPCKQRGFARKWAEQGASFIGLQHACVHLQSNKTVWQARNGQSNVIWISWSIGIQTYLCRHQSQYNV